MATAGPQTQSQDSRDEILKAAIQLFANRGFHETSMSEVAREAKVSKALIFWHFKTKEELFLAVLNKLLEPYVIDFAEESENLDECEQIRKLIAGYVNFVRENASSVSFFLAPLHERRRDARRLHRADSPALRALYRAADRPHSPRPGKGAVLALRAPDVLANFVLAALNGLLINLLFTGEMPFNLDGALAMLHGLLFEKAGSQPGAATQPKP